MDKDLSWRGMYTNILNGGFLEKYLKTFRNQSKQQAPEKSGPEGEGVINQKPSGNHLLRVQVYDYLQEQMRRGVLKPGASISVKQLIEELGISRTPLREALLLLQEQGFVSILPQRGVRINQLTLKDVREIYEILGGIESRVILSVFYRIGKKEIRAMERLNHAMEKAIEKGDMDLYNSSNIEFHDVILNLSDNERMLSYVKVLKRQLYDFPKRDFGRQWNEKNLSEHRMLIRLIKEGEPDAVACYMRDVHWEFDPPEHLKDGKEDRDYSL